MFRKIALSIVVIIGLVIAASFIEIRIAQDADKIDLKQSRALRAVKNAELIHNNIIALEHNALQYYFHGDEKSVKSFWKEYKKSLANIDQLTIPMHNGDCVPCHKAFLSTRSAFKEMLSLTEKSR